MTQVLARGDVTVTVTGLREVRSSLEALARGAQDLDLTEAGRLVEDAARSRARRLTGAMAGSITSTRTGGSLEVGASAPHTPPQHSGSIRGVSPNPFLHQGLDAAEPAAVAAVDRSLDRLVRRYF